MPDLPYDEAAAGKAVGIFNNLRLPDVPGQPSLGEAGGSWFRQILAYTYGCLDEETGHRLIGEVFLLVPKKNSKTTNAAGLGLTALLLNRVPNAEMMIVGPTKDIANKCFKQICDMIGADPADAVTGEPWLPKRFHIVEGQQQIKDRHTGAILSVKAFSTKVVTGSIPILVIIDELHVLGASPHAEDVLAQLRGGMITRPGSLLVFITTQSDKPPRGVFKKELDYARKVRDGEIKGGNTLVCLYEFPEAFQRSKHKEWLDPKYWRMITPNMGLSIREDALLQLYRKAHEKGIDEEILWASQHANIQIGMGLHNDRWIGVDFWPSASAPLTFEGLLDQSDVVTCGIDGGGLNDLLGFCALGRHHETGIWHAWVRAWAQPIVLERRKQIATQLRDFEADGDLIICSEPVQDILEVAALCAAVNDRGLLPESWGVGLDPYGIAALVQELAGAGLEGDVLAKVTQGAALSSSVWTCERRLSDGTMLHADQPLMNWCVSNAKTEQRGNAVMITKAISGTGKIDPLIALYNAASLMARNPEAAGNRTSPWDDPEFSIRNKR